MSRPPSASPRLDAAGGAASDFAHTTAADEAPPTEQAPDPVPDVPPEPVFALTELFNETLAFSHFASGANEDAQFLLVEGARAVRATVWVRLECPLTTHADPRVSLTAPDGGVQDVPVMAESNASACPFVDPEFVVVDELDLATSVGEWTVETAGDCSCDARVTVAAEVPA